MSNTSDLWKLLKEYEVVIPVIQRDYAQGRKDKEYIRRSFLNEIKDHINKRTPITLDFVYGNIEGNRFYPLDGQQRLTTLWLIHWYISLKAEKLDEDKKYLSKFFYETRSSSAEFCKALCQSCDAEKMKDAGKIVDYIKSQTWFYASWLQDPTISAMLRTLGGDNEPTDDNIEAVFSEVDYQEYRDRLINQSVVNFELMKIGTEKLPISDDLYIKMNARGKGLTDFENFKADLVAWIQNPQNPNESMYLQTVEGEKTYKQHYPAQIDNAWMDVFWKSARQNAGPEFDGEIDDIYFAFINRYVLNRICLRTEMSPEEYAFKKEDAAHKPIKLEFDKLFGAGQRNASADDSLISYEGFEIYKKYLTFETLEKLNYIFKVVSDGKNPEVIEKALTISDADEEEKSSAGYTFIPRYIAEKDRQKLASIKQKGRVYFLAVSLFIENGQALSANGLDEGKFNKWMRVVKNLVENAAIDNIPAMVTCMRLINKLAEQLKQHDNNIYETLKEYPDSFSNSRLESQLREEKEKAVKIMEDDSWGSKFEEAERYAFFNGTIRFLYKNGQSLSWNDFDAKFSRAKELFNEGKTVPVDTIVLFLKQFSCFKDIEGKYLFTSEGYHPRHKCWKKEILCSEDAVIANGVHNLLMGNSGPEMGTDYRSFINSGLVEKTVSKEENYRYKYRCNRAIHKDYSQTEGVYLSEERKQKNEELHTLVENNTIRIVAPSYNSYHDGYYWGVRIDFEYNNRIFRWYERSEAGQRTDKIYLIENDMESAHSVMWEDGKKLMDILNEQM